MSKPELIQAFNDQVREELNSYYVYMALSADMDFLSLTGTAAWFRKQADEERAHAQRFLRFMADTGARVAFQALPQPASGTKTMKEAFTKALVHEKELSVCIHKLVKLARQLDDLPAESFLKWFIDEQVEEEKVDVEILAKIELAGGMPGSQYLIDHDLGKQAS